MEFKRGMTERKFEVVLCVTIGLVLLVGGVTFLLRYTPPCSQFYEGPICGPAPLYAGIIMTATSVLLLVIGLVLVLTSPRTDAGLIPPRARLK